MDGRLSPLGYDVADRKLVVNTAEADTVRHIFERYTALGSVRALQFDLREAGIVSKARSGERSGARPLARGTLYYMLQNRLYRGEIVHKENVYPGQHDAIVGPELWDRVQAVLIENRVERVRGGGATQPSLLTGLVYDAGGGRMSPSHANKNGTRYRYYVSQSLLKQARSEAPATACRVPAADLEAVVEAGLRDLLSDVAALHDVARAAGTDTAGRKALLAEAGDLARRWSGLPASDRIAMLAAVLVRITIQVEAVVIDIQPTRLLQLIRPDLERSRSDLPPIKRTIPARLRRTGLQTRLLIDADQGRRREPDRSLLRLLARAH